MAKKYDVIVVGAGPAGLMAARTAKREGLDVLLVDIKPLRAGFYPARKGKRGDKQAFLLA